MPLTQLNFQPGIDTENTQTGAEGRWIDGDKIRFRKGLPQKIGGWIKFSEAYYELDYLLSKLVWNIVLAKKQCLSP